MVPLIWRLCAEKDFCTEMTNPARKLSRCGRACPGDLLYWVEGSSGFRGLPMGQFAPRKSPVCTRRVKLPTITIPMAPPPPTIRHKVTFRDLGKQRTELHAQRFWRLHQKLFDKLEIALIHRQRVFFLQYLCPHLGSQNVILFLERFQCGVALKIIALNVQIQPRMVA